MSGKGTYLINAVLDLLGGTAITPPATVYLALYTVAPGAGGVGGTEVTGNGYARIAVPNNSTNWPAAASNGSVKKNAVILTFPTATGAGWATVVAAAILDQPTAGNPYYWGTVSVSQAIGGGDAPSFPAGSIQITES